MGQFKVTTFTKLHESIQNATLFGANYPSVFLGTAQLGQTQFSITALGTWDVTTLCSFMLLMMFVAKVVAGIKLNKLIDGIGEGLKISYQTCCIISYDLCYLSILCKLSCNSIIYKWY